MEEINRQNSILEFESKIKEYEDVLFGLNLFIQGIHYLWEYNKTIVDTNQQHYESAKKRMEEVISSAKKLLEETKKSFVGISLLQQFPFPPIKGHPILDEGTKRYKALTQAYNELFPNRPKNKPLTKEENRKLTEVVINKINL